MKAKIKSLLLKTSLLLLGVAAAHAGNFTVLHSFGSSNKITGGFPNAMLTQSPQGTLYGIDGPGTTLHYDGTRYSTIQQADANVYGTIFAVNPDGTGFQTLHIFTNVLDGSNAVGGMVLVGDTLYGTTYGGGSHYGGTVFRINTNGSGFTHLYDFGSVTNDGLFPSGTLVHSNGILYGTTFEGGLSGGGTVFSLSTSGGAPSYLVNFNGTNGSSPWAGLALSSNTLFGSTRSGFGGIYKVAINGTGFSVIASGVSMLRPLCLTNNLLYGADSPVGTHGRIFSLNTDGSDFSSLYTFPYTTNRNSAGHETNSEGYIPACVVVVSNRIYGVTQRGGTNGYGTLFSIDTTGSSFNLLQTLEPASSSSLGTMILGDRIYGTQTYGGHGYGFLFSLNLDGSGYTNFFNFGASDGLNPSGPLTVNIGYLYGATTFGGAGGYGMVYKIGTNGTGYTNVHDFSGDTSQPVSGFVIRSNVVYGSTGSSWNNTGAIFTVDADGSNYSLLHHLGSELGTEFASASPLVSVGNKIFGAGSAVGGGSIFSIDADGQNYTNISVGTVSPLVVSGGLIYCMVNLHGLYLFSHATTGVSGSLLFGLPSGATDIQNPPTLIGDKCYGVSYNGGSFGKGSIYSINTNGSNFTILHSFSGPDGRSPHANLTLANGALYGTTGLGGDYNYGTIFSINTDGTGFAIHHMFTGGGDGGFTIDGLQLSGHTLYGTTPIGGDMNSGTIFALTAEPLLSSQISDDNLILSWPDPTFSLQSAPAATGSYTTIVGATSPYTNALSGTQLYFRLISN